MQSASAFVKSTLLVKSQAKAAGFQTPFSDLSGDFATTHWDFAKRIHKSNEVENVSLLVYVHKFTHVESFHDWLKAHSFDHENCPHQTWDVAILAWKTFYLQKLGRYVTVLIIGNSQKSISDALHWHKKGIGLAANEYMRRFECYPDYLMKI
jgi:hypothetical protein